MVFHMLPTRVKKQKSWWAKNLKMQHAMDEYRWEQLKEKPSSLCKIAAKFAVSFTTLGWLVKEGVSMSAFNLSKQKIKPEEEVVLVNFILESADQGLPPTHHSIKLYANDILKSHVSDGYEWVGIKWVFGFLDHHCDQLQSHWSKPLDTQRARALNPKAKKAWYKMVDREVIQQGVCVEDIYGMDQSGFPPSHQDWERVVGAWGMKTQHKQGGANQENVMAIVTSCADRMTLNPLSIFKGKNFLKKWGNNNVTHAL